jgi:protein phosphatase
VTDPAPERPQRDGASHIGGRSENQDGWAVARRGAATLFAVADGLGGHLFGREAARTALEAALANFGTVDGAPDVMARDAVAAAAAAVRAMRVQTASDMASTLVLLVLSEQRAGWAWCGDSRLYRLRGDAIVRLTNDHSVAMAQLDAAARADADVRGNPSRNRLISVLGEEDPLIDGVCDEWLPGDCFALCSDGYWEGSSRAEIGEGLARGTSAQDMLGAVLGKQHTDQDNLTLLIAR